MANDIIINFMANLNHTGSLKITQNVINLYIKNDLVSKVEGEIFMAYVNANRDLEHPGLGGGTIEGYISFATAATAAFTAIAKF